MRRNLSNHITHLQRHWKTDVILYFNLDGVQGDR